MAPPNPPQGGFTPEEQEKRKAQEARDNAVRRAMLDDLGLQRLEELPLQDKGTRYASQPMTGHIRPTMHVAWRAAMDNGTFQDDDAEAVQGLEVLPGRLYDHALPDNNGPGTHFSHSRRPGPGPAPRPVYPGQSVHPGQQAHQGQSRQPVHPSRQRFEQETQRRTAQALDILHKTNVQNSAQKRRRRNPNQPPAQPTPQPTPQRARGGTSNNARGGLSPQPPARPPRAAPPARAPIAAMETAPFPEIEPQGHVFRSPIVFCDATSRQRVPACVYLVSTETPELGYFVVYILGREFCRIPLAQTNNTTTSSEGGEHDVMIMFKCDGRILSYLLTFQSQELQAAFIKTERGLRSRTVSSTQGQRATSAAIPPPSVEPTSRDDGTTLIYGSGSVSMSITISEGEGSIPMDSEASVSRAIPAPVTPTTVGGLINLDAEEEDQAAAAESATELLATLGPVVYEGAENEADDQEPQPVVEPTEMIRIQYRLIQRVFRQAGVNELRAEEAIRDAFALYLPRIFPAMDQSQLERLAAEVIDSEARERFTRRTSYLPSEIFDLREHAVDPPAWLGDLDYLPKRRSGQRAQEAEPISPFQGRYDTAGIARSAAGYNWAMGLAVQAVPETSTAITGAGTLPGNTIGLRGSQCANGPIRSEDAAERRTISSPQVPSATPVIPATPVAAPMAALAATPTEPHPASARSSRPSANVIQNTTAADEIENLSVNLARLSIGNPGQTDLTQESPGTTSELALTSAAPVQTAALRFVAAEVAVAAPISAQKTPVRARGLAASRHAM